MEKIKTKIKFKRNESFSIREGWLEKGLNYFKEEPNLFKLEVGIKVLGIGSNMVKSLKYWMEAANLITQDNKTYVLTDFANALLNYDRYLENSFSWWMIHYYIAKNIEKSPVINTLFNSNQTKFDRESLKNLVVDTFEEAKNIPESSIENDVAVAIRTYSNNDYSNPEQNLSCPLAKLGLLNQVSNKEYMKASPKRDTLNYLVVYFAIIDNYNEDESFNLSDLLEKRNNPVKLFNITSSMLYSYLDEMQKQGLITLIKTAGLNTITINKKLSIEELFDKKYNA